MRKKKLNRKILNIITLFLVVLFSSVVGVYAERIIASSKVTYSNGTSGLSSTNVQGAIDELYLKYAKCAKSFGNFACFLQTLEASDTVIADDGTTDHNMRFTGTSPNNYVIFAGEEWRIIGAFNNIDNGTGKKESRVKIIKSESIGNKSWDSNNVNIWKNASLNEELQSLTYASNSLVANAVWHLGDPGGDYTYTAAQAYTYERGTTVSSGNDATWTGKVGLMYPSDYGFALSTENVFKNLYAPNYGTIVLGDKNWLFLRSSDEWILSPNSDDAIYVRAIGFNGHIFGNNIGSSAKNFLAVRPTIYLKSSVTCKNCNEATAGTKENPFQIA